MWPSMRAQREYELMKWKELSAEEQAAAWLRRQMYLWTQFLTNKWVQEHLTPTVGCPACGPYRLGAHGWPEYFECVCGTIVILDRWLADGVERTTMMTYEGLEKFFEMHEKVFDLYNYPLESRLADLRGWKSGMESQPEGWDG
jgi:hypothetical protein